MNASKTPHASKLLVLGRRIGPIFFGETKAEIQAAYGTGQLVRLPPTNVGVVFYPGSTVGQLKKIGADCALTVGSCQLAVSSSQAGTTFFLDNHDARVARVAISTGH